MKHQLYQHTERLLSAVNQLDLPKLRNMVDDDFGIVDVDPEGNPIVINTMEEWESYMEKNMLAMQQLHARLSYEIDEYHENVSDSMAYVVVRFVQQVHIPEKQEMSHSCIATVVWKKTEDGWKEARWHCSRLPS
jgi:ketosteroid isomerase-like protein